jgi:translation initiation factor IF-2
MICRHILGLHVGLRSGIFAGAILVAVGVSPVHAQSGDPISPPANSGAPADSTPSSDHVRKPTEPPPFDSNLPPARAARVKAKPSDAPAPRTAESTPHATPPRPAVTSTPSAGAAQPRWPATAIDPSAEPAATHPAPVSRPTERERWSDPWAEPAPAPAPVSRSTTRRRAEPAKVIGIDSLGRSTEDLAPEPSPAARPRRGAGPGADAAPAETTEETLPR